MTPNDIIDDARRLAQDNGLFRTPDTYSAATMLRLTNQVLRQTAVLRPDLFVLLGDIPTTPEVAEQSAPADSLRLVSIRSIKDGPAITEVSYDTMDRSYPQWRLDPAGTPVNFMRNVRNPNGYFLYPRPAAGTVLTGEYVQSPPEYTGDQQIALLPDAFQPVMVAGVIMLIAAIENPSLDPARYKQFADMYSQSLRANMEGRVLTDTPAAGLEPKQVI